MRIVSEAARLGAAPGIRAETQDSRKRLKIVTSCASIAEAHIVRLLFQRPPYRRTVMSKSTLIAPGYVEGQGSGVDRRQLLKAGAWATPVLVMAAAAPMAVASDRPKFDQAKITVSAECAYRSRSFTVKNTAPAGVANVTLSLHA